MIGDTVTDLFSRLRRRMVYAVCAGQAAHNRQFIWVSLQRIGNGISAIPVRGVGYNRVSVCIHDIHVQPGHCVVQINLHPVMIQFGIECCGA